MYFRMTSDNSRIKIAIIPYGLRQEETIVQIAAALDDISSVVTDVFEQIENNIRKHGEYLNSLKKRTSTVASKIDELAGKNVTTALYSHHKFPVERFRVDTLFEMKLKPAARTSNAVPIESRFPHVKYNRVPSKLQFFHVNSAQSASASAQHGLGGVPAEIEHVDSLFLFNTCENIYARYALLDPLAVANDRPAATQEPTETSDIAAAPNSIVNSEAYRNENYFTGFYTPAFEEVPGIDVPADLPDLPGIADDPKSGAVGAPATPAKRPVDGKAKSIDEITVADLPVISKPKKPVGDREPSAVQPPSSVPAAPPQTSVPVPPPPPPMPEDFGDAAAVTRRGADVAKNAVPGGDVHATLMEAIRKAGGRERAQLRQVDSSDDQPASSASKKDGETMFIDDLYAALARRRKGISGLNKDNKNVSMMDRVSAMIPQASEDESDDNSVDDGTEWED